MHRRSTKAPPPPSDVEVGTSISHGSNLQQNGISSQAARRRRREPRGPVLDTAETQRRRQRRRRLLRKQQQRQQQQRQRLGMILLVALVTIVVLSRRWRGHGTETNPKVPAVFLQHHALYETIRARDRVLVSGVDPLDDEIRCPRDRLQPTYGDAVDTCRLTIFVLDPRLGDPHAFGVGHAVWFALESVGAFANFSCVLLLTSQCPTGSATQAQQQPSGDRIRDEIYRRSLPLFRKMIDRGLVRLKTDLDWRKYQLQSCSDYGNPTPALLNRNFWVDEFFETQDSSMVLLLQDDAVLCRPLDDTFFSLFGDTAAFLGGVWPPESSPFMPHPPEGMCDGQPGLWFSWLRPQRMWERYRGATTTDRRGGHSPPVEPSIVLETDFLPVCGHGYGPVGNGGFSLRNRHWMIRAIETCPHVKYSGLDEEAKLRVACKVHDAVNDDLYLSVVLHGLRAPSVTAVRASLFAVEMLWPEQVRELYPLPAGHEDEVLMGPAAEQATGSSSVSSTTSTIPRVSWGGREWTMPYGIHKPWWYHPNELLQSEGMREQCPFLPFLFYPNMSRWRTFETEQWHGIGT